MIVDIWLTQVDDASRARRREAELDGDEREREARFRYDRDRVRFVNRRAYLREVLGEYLDVAPRQVPLRTARNGRPVLDMPTDLTFSASHSDGTAVVAVTRGRSVGVDIEHVRPIDEALDIAAGTFTLEEAERLRSTPRAVRSAAFLELWTRKESFVKAVGRGLGIGLDRFDVSAHDDRGFGAPLDSAGPLPYTTGRLPAPLGFVGAVTVGGDCLRIKVADPEVAAR